MTQRNGNGNGKTDIVNDEAATVAPTAPVDAETAAIAEIRRAASQIQVVERVHGGGTAFEQQAHTLMLESVDRITQQWVAELGHVRANMDTIEQMVIAQAAKVKDEITKLHLLGVSAMKEAQRGHEVAHTLAAELETMMASEVQTH